MGKQIDGNTRRLVSPSFEIPMGDLPEKTFRLLMQPSVGRSFARSKGVGIIKLKCESDFQGHITHALQFSMQVGSDLRGPIFHDFSSHPVGGLPSGSDVWHLWPQVDLPSNTLTVTLHIQLGDEEDAVT